MTIILESVIISDAVIKYVCVAQLDRALGYGPRCRGFESSRARMRRLSKPIGLLSLLLSERNRGQIIERRVRTNQGKKSFE